MSDKSTHLCEQLNPFLDGELSVGERHDFAAHLSECHACREAVEQQDWIDSLLTSVEAAELEAAPRLVLSRRSRRSWMVAAAAAIAALAALPQMPLPSREGSGEGRQTLPSVTASEAVATVENPSPSPSLPGRGTLRAPAATFASAGGAIAVPVAAADAEVTVVRLYPTVTATRRWARERALLAPPSKSNGG